jgi:methylated-DNA-[protein]-cysteine S-methyltransferase
MGKPCKLNWTRFDLENHSPFARKVYSELLKIKHGTTLSYKELAHRSGKPSAARAVGMIVGRNPVPLLIPCHRVIKTDGSAGGFSADGGVSMKIEMLALEGLKISTKAHTGISNSGKKEDSIDKAIRAISQADPELATWISKLPRFHLATSDSTTTFQALLEAIVYQQLTGKAAATIYARLLDLFGAHRVAPLDIIRARDTELRQAGLSGPKILAIRDLAEKDLAGMVPDMKSLSNMCDDEIVKKLVNIRGIGRWTAEMLLIFKLGRLDVLPIDDYGIKKGLAILRNYQKLPSPQQLTHEGRIWQPYRTIASWYLWRIAESAKRI